MCNNIDLLKTKNMKKLLFLLFAVSIFTVACQKDEVVPPKPIDKFVKTFNGNLKTYTCEENQALLNTNPASVIITKENDTDLLGSLKDDSGNKLFTFSGKFNAAKENEFKISNFSYNSETLFGAGEMIDGKLKLSFASFNCQVDSSNTYRVTREFKEN